MQTQTCVKSDHYLFWPGRRFLTSEQGLHAPSRSCHAPSRFPLNVHRSLLPWTSQLIPCTWLHTCRCVITCGSARLSSFSSTSPYQNVPLALLNRKSCNLITQSSTNPFPYNPLWNFPPHPFVHMILQATLRECHRYQPTHNSKTGPFNTSSLPYAPEYTNNHKFVQRGPSLLLRLVQVFYGTRFRYTFTSSRIEGRDMGCKICRNGKCLVDRDSGDTIILRIAQGFIRDMRARWGHVQLSTTVWNWNQSLDCTTRIGVDDMV